uniref:Uncharacterized protein n=1 Tax=Picea sitchensis TaxID=3332 RepID=D5ABT5_PICSI|nr:unknown [Picea sitchensis]
MSDLALLTRGRQNRVPLIERRQGKCSAHRMWIDLPQPNALPKLETVSTGKELPQKESKRAPKSRIDSELQELKGSMELGFEFRKDQLTPRLLNLLPGLKRLLDHENSTDILGFEESPLENWELPNLNAAEVDMKEHIKLWARSVASTLKNYYEQHVNVSV